MLWQIIFFLFTYFVATLFPFLFLSKRPVASPTQKKRIKDFFLISNIWLILNLLFFQRTQSFFSFYLFFFALLGSSYVFRKFSTTKLHLWTLPTNFFNITLIIFLVCLFVVLSFCLFTCLSTYLFIFLRQDYCFVVALEYISNIILFIILSYWHLNTHTNALALSYILSLWILLRTFSRVQ